MEKLSMNDIRKKNYSDVYRLIYQEQRISKSRIASALEMSLPTVTQHLSSMEAEGLIEKQGQLASGIGRKAAAYRIRPAARAAVGVEVLPSGRPPWSLTCMGPRSQKKSAPWPFLRRARTSRALPG